MLNFLKAALVFSLIAATLFAGAQREGRSAGRSGRLRPPQEIECPRDKLTSFTGRVVSYSRGAERIVIGMRTDEATTEKFILRYSKQEDPTKWFLLRGERFPPGDWDAIESGKGRLRPGVRATVWVCEGPDKPVVDWDHPPHQEKEN